MTIRGTAIHRPKAEAAATREAFGKSLVAWMREMGIDAPTLARLCRVSPAAISRWRNGDALPAEQHMHTLERAGFVWTP